MNKKKIVIVEDEPGISEALEYTLIKEGFAVRVLPDGEQALKLLETEVPDLLLLDLMLPGLDGLEICRRMKKKESTSDIPIIMVTAKGEESDIVLGLGIGADDYVTKPFRMRELVGRVKAVLRRGPFREGKHQAVNITIKGLEIDQDKFTVRADGDVAGLTATEFRLLYHLASYPGRVFTRDQLLNAAVDDKTFVLDRNIDVHVRSIRKKLGDCGQLLETVRGVGYRIVDEEDE
ncbi:Phosphate regulon transcriptional regulatory protein PhoB (SphR) [hydrothermal vent metagenome]|uniref:Phosphate regulon transcriptional regulatory protein PhoB (SphR) n=1 Tax=hydrothermal vent metagenome TaxID=652676 RepID=A0A3B1CIK7_9ZZZZ